MANPFRQLLEHLIFSPVAETNGEQLISDVAGDESPVDETPASSKQETEAETSSNDPPFITNDDPPRVAESVSRLEPTQSITIADETRLEHAPIERGPPEATSDRRTPIDLYDLIQIGPSPPLSTAGERLPDDLPAGTSSAAQDRLTIESLPIVPDAIAPVDQQTTFASLNVNEPDWRSFPPRMAPPSHTQTSHSAPQTSPNAESSLESRIEELLGSFEQTGPQRDQTRTLERLEAALQRLLASQLDLTRFSERLDQLETAHVLRGRL